jgi:hypothetical protein
MNWEPSADPAAATYSNNDRFEPEDAPLPPVREVPPPPVPSVVDVQPPPVPPVQEVPPPPPPPVPPVQEVPPPPPPSVVDVPFEDVLAMVLQLRDLQQRLIARVAGHRASEIPSEMREQLAMEVGLCRRWTSLIDDWLGSSWTFWPKQS